MPRSAIFLLISAAAQLQEKRALKKKRGKKLNIKTILLAVSFNIKYKIKY
jgi:hypothetical protein